MEWIDYLLIGVLAIALVGIALHLIYRKKQGKSGCGCGCAYCPSAGSCPSIQSANRQEPTEESKKDTQEEKNYAETI